MIMVLERCNEFQLPLWAAAIGFQKASDTVEHGSMWVAMDQMGVPMTSIRIFAQLYREQRGVVATDAESRSFKIQRGTTQGNPSSPNIFNEFALAEAQQGWRRKGWGIDIGRGRLNALCSLSLQMIS